MRLVGDVEAEEALGDAAGDDARQGPALHGHAGGQRRVVLQADGCAFAWENKVCLAVENVGSSLWSFVRGEPLCVAFVFFLVLFVIRGRSRARVDLRRVHAGPGRKGPARVVLAFGVLAGRGAVGIEGRLAALVGALDDLLAAAGELGVQRLAAVGADLHLDLLPPDLPPCVRVELGHDHVLHRTHAVDAGAERGGGNADDDDELLAGDILLVGGEQVARALGDDDLDVVAQRVERLALVLLDQVRGR